MSFDWRDIPAVPEARSRRGEATRQRIIEAASDLFAEKGIDGVELGEILAAAGQHNASAIQYHFGSRNGLIVAVLAPRPEIRGPLDVARMDAMERLLVDGRPVTLEDAVDALVRPTMCTLASHAGRSFLRVAAQVIRLLPAENRADSIDSARTRLVALIESRMPEMPEAVRRERLATGITLFLEMMANRAREIEAGTPHNLDDDDFLTEAASMLIGLLSAPVRIPGR